MRFVNVRADMRCGLGRDVPARMRVILEDHLAQQFTEGPNPVASETIRSIAVFSGPPVAPSACARENLEPLHLASS